MRFLRSFFLPFLLILYSHVSSNYSTSLPLKTQGLLKLRAYRSITDQRDSTTPTNDDIENLPFEDLQKLEKDADDKLTETRKSLSDKKSELESKKEKAKVPLLDYEEKKSKFEELDGIAKGMNKELNEANDEFIIAEEESNNADDLFKEFTDATTKVAEDTIREEYVKDAPNRQSIAQTEKADWKSKCDPLEGKKVRLKAEIKGKNETAILKKKKFKDQQKIVDECIQNCGDAQKTLTDVEGELSTAESELKQAVDKLALAIECPDLMKKINKEVEDLNEIMNDHPKAVTEAQETVAASIESSKNPKFDGIEAIKKAANDKLKQKKEAKEAAEATAKTPEEVEAAKGAASNAELKLQGATNTKNRLEGEIRDISNTIDELQKKVVSEEARVEKLRKVLEKKSEKPAKSASWLIGVYIFVVLAVVAAIVFVIVKWGLPRLKLAKNARNGTQSAAKDSAAVPASETAGSKQSEVSQKLPEGDVQPQVPAANTVSPTPTPLSTSQTPTKLETAAKMATELETAAQTQSLVESATQTSTEHCQTATLLESATQNTSTIGSVGATPTKACSTGLSRTNTCSTGLSPSKPVRIQQGKFWSKLLSVNDLPVDTKKQRMLKQHLKKMMKKKGLKITILRHEVFGGIMYRIEDKKGQIMEEGRYFSNGFSTYVQHAEYFQEGTIDYKNNRMVITKRNSREIVEHPEVAYETKVSIMYKAADGTRMSAAKRKEEKKATKESLDKQKVYRLDKEARQAEEENSPSDRSNSEKDDRTSEKSDEEKTNSSRKKTRIGIANKKRKSGKGNYKRKRAKKHQKRSNKDDNSASPDSEEPNTKPHNAVRGADGKVKSIRAGVEPGESEEFYNPKRGDIQRRIDEEPTKRVTNPELLKIAKEMETAIQRGEKYSLPNKVRMYIIREGKKKFKKEPSYIKLEKGPVNVCADLHGNGDNLLQMFAVFDGIESEEFKKQRFIFLGDYVDRGLHSDECLNLLLILKIVYPDKFTLLRGNHETYAISLAYGFQRELIAKMGVKDGAKFHEYYSYMFSYMPLCCTCNRMFFMHGGIPRKRDLGDTWNIEKINDLVPKFLWDVRDNNIACQLTWGDPRFGLEGFQDSSRGVAWEFGEDVVREFCKANDLRGVVRGHQKIQNGFEFFAGDMLCSLFTCSNYESAGTTPNNAAFMSIDKHNAAYFHIFTNKGIVTAKMEHDMNLWITNLHVDRDAGEDWRIERKDESETVDRSPKKPYKRPTGGRPFEGNKKPAVKRLGPKPAVKGASPKPEKEPWYRAEKNAGPDGPPADPISHIPTKSGREI